MKTLLHDLHCIRILYWLLLGTAPLVLSQQVRADFVIDIASFVQQESPDSWKYSYVVTNRSTAGERLYVLDVNFGVDVELSGLIAPTDWTSYYTAGESGVSWLSENSENDVMPGMSASFSMLANVAPDNHVAIASGEDQQGVGTEFSTFVKAPGPGVIVPEPSSIIQALTGLLITAWAYLCRWMR